MQEALSVTVTRYVNIVLADDNSKPVLVGTGYQPIAKKYQAAASFLVSLNRLTYLTQYCTYRLLFILVETYKNTFFLH